MRRKIFQRSWLLLALACCAAAAYLPALAQGPAPEGGEAPFSAGFFGKSLHRTGEGMRYWYEQPGGFKDLTGIPYAEVKCQECTEDHFACTSCHADSCDRCHAKGTTGNMSYSVAEAKKKSERCLGCHVREKTAAKLDAEAGSPDVHFAAGMGCVDCHGPQEIHGDGVPYRSMKSPGATRVSCSFCHGGGTGGKGRYDPELKSHKIHAKRLDCSACHVKGTMTCYSCHFDAAMKSGEKKGNFIPMKSWLLLVNHEDKVTAGGVQTLVWKGKPFIAYAPQFTHSVTGAGRQCSECHANEAVKLMTAGKKVPVVAFKEGKVSAWEGVVPGVPERLEWAFLEKKDGRWVPVSGQAKEQWVGYATPLNADQLKRMARPMAD